MAPMASLLLFDVDGTLIGSIRSDRLRPGARELLETLRVRETTLVLWSAGGADYAERMLARFDIDHFFSGFYAKDSRCAEGRYRIDHLAPEHRPGTLVDDYPDEVPYTGRVIGVPQVLGSNATDSGLALARKIAAGGRGTASGD